MYVITNAADNKDVKNNTHMSIIMENYLQHIEEEFTKVKEMKGFLLFGMVHSTVVLIEILLCFKSASNLKAALCDLTTESVVKVTGTVRRRPAGQENKVCVCLCVTACNKLFSKHL